MLSSKLQPLKTHNLILFLFINKSIDIKRKSECPERYLHRRGIGGDLSIGDKSYVYEILVKGNVKIILTAESDDDEFFLKVKLLSRDPSVYSVHIESRGGAVTNAVKYEVGIDRFGEVLFKLFKYENLLKRKKYAAEIR